MTQKDMAASVLELLETMEILRSPQGCPWDTQQTPSSLTPYIIEEACELVDAIDQGDVHHIKDELGDLLLQVVFLAQIFKERGLFDFADIAGTINDKLLRRHPHVFEEGFHRLDDDALDEQWRMIKNQENPHREDLRQLPTHLSKHLPSLQRAQKLTAKIDEAHIDIQKLLPNSADKTSSLEKLGSIDLDETNLGWLLFKIAMRAQREGLDAERAVRKTIWAIVEQLEQLQFAEEEQDDSAMKETP